MKFSALKLTALALVASLLTGCGGGRTASYRVRMTVEVQTPEGLETGSSVIEIRLTRGMAIGDSSGVSSSVRGEAVVVNLPDGPLFVLLQVPDAGAPLQTIVPEALLGRPSSGPDQVMADTAKLGSTWFSGYKADLPRTHYNRFQSNNDGWPIMVRFRDLNDPKSMSRVDPDAVGVKRILLETTRDGVTTGIEKRIPWVDHLDQYLADRGNPFTSTLPENFGGFRSGAR